MKIVKYMGTVLCCVFLALSGGCASKQPETSGMPRGASSATTDTAAIPPMESYGAYALDGPDLCVVGDLAGTPLRGTMQRKSMVGIGKLQLRSPDSPLICESSIKTPPTEKGRVRGILDCNDGKIVLFTLRNLGPDQGLGIGTSYEGDEDLTLFYHPSAEEAQRRFPQVLEEFTLLRQEKRS